MKEIYILRRRNEASGFEDVLFENLSNEIIERSEDKEEVFEIWEGWRGLKVFIGLEVNDLREKKMFNNQK